MGILWMNIVSLFLDWSLEANSGTDLDCMISQWQDSCVSFMADLHTNISMKHVWKDD